MWCANALSIFCENAQTTKIALGDSERAVPEGLEGFESDQTLRSPLVFERVNLVLGDQTLGFSEFWPKDHSSAKTIGNQADKGKSYKPIQQWWNYYKRLYQWKKAVGLDFSKTFDTVLHAWLLKDLLNNNMSNTIKKLFYGSIECCKSKPK